MINLEKTKQGIEIKPEMIIEDNAGKQIKIVDLDAWKWSAKNCRDRNVNYVAYPFIPPFKEYRISLDRLITCLDASNCRIIKEK